jgi:hypothetical protein
MTSRIVSLLLLSTLLFSLGCGGSALNPIHPPTVQAAPGFPAATALTCSGIATDPAGMICDESDGHSLYQHYHVQVTIRADGHGTFHISTETGISKAPGTYELIFKLPQTVNMAEIHGTLNLTSWCDQNGLNTVWNGAAPYGPTEHLIAGKTFTFKNGDTANFAIPQVIFPVPVPLSELYLYVNNDLCASSTVSWTLNGSF